MEFEYDELLMLALLLFASEDDEPTMRRQRDVCGVTPQPDPPSLPKAPKTHCNMEADSSNSKTEEERDSIALLLDSVPQLESLFVINQCIGHGTFSSVYLARTKHNTTINGRKHFAVKHIIPTSHPSRVYMELKCLKMIGGSDNVMGVTMCFRQMNHIVLIMPHFPHNSFSEYVGCLSTEELRDYLVALLVALRRVHSFNIIHRDVKPANFLYNRKYKRYSLVDFGLAQEVGQRRRSIGGGRTAKATITTPSIVVISPPVLDTPCPPASRTVKRKLGVLTSGDGDSYDGERSKRPRHMTSPSAPHTCVLSSTSSRVNTVLRRSPRKQCSSILMSPKKENLEALLEEDLKCTPKKNHINTVLAQDSPSKHTRSAEACRKLDSIDGGEFGVNSDLQVKCEPLRTLRRSPRKAMSGSHTAGPLDGLIKHLQQVSERHGSNSTPVMRTGKTKAEDGSGSCESVIAGKNAGQRLCQNVANCSPKVSGLILTPDHSTTTTKSVKSGKVLQEVKTKSGSMLCPVSCHCYGSAKVCRVCIGRSNQVAPRAGTPGFRAPEVLLRHPHQGTGVDMWSVGVILLSLLSGRYPFFRAADDLSTLAEITTLLGTTIVRKAAAKIEKLVTCSVEKQPLDLMKVCEILRNNTGSEVGGGDECVTGSRVCPGCRQRNICVCMVPPSTAAASSGKKKMITQDPQRKSGFSITNLSPSSSSRKAKSVTSQKDTGTLSTQQHHHLLTQAHNNILKETSEHSSTNKVILTHPGLPPSPSSSPHPEKRDSNENPSPAVTNDILKISDHISSSSRKSGCAPPVYPRQVYHLLLRLLDPDPETRITAENALAHPFLTSA
ncbi:hypothetical protein Pmani_024382 [Petrolisthes manimaculis]|uniref:non-specific serine/threonine protein kinase n=1 Tax=Petrolisthes manimaculis TaxID=1843537 RepID=A0AAE1P8W2_9EUCA|nr:hypothetical protein Pmani_024382 [Petrolisthes manimaculis]